ncbi:hypothetical protein KAX97_09970 [candidate division WOR-3 bacterium]|nr:hypothetical protein [candidate division WOR-3 bacterium]
MDDAYILIDNVKQPVRYIGLKICEDGWLIKTVCLINFNQYSKDQNIQKFIHKIMKSKTKLEPSISKNIIEDIPSEPLALQKQLQQVLQLVSEMEAIYGIAPEDELYDALQRYPGIGRAEAAHLIAVLMKEGLIYLRRLGQYKTTLPIKVKEKEIMFTEGSKNPGNTTKKYMNKIKILLSDSNFIAIIKGYTNYYEIRDNETIYIILKIDINNNKNKYIPQSPTTMHKTKFTEIYDQLIHLEVLPETQKTISWSIGITRIYDWYKIAMALNIIESWIHKNLLNMRWSDEEILRQNTLKNIDDHNIRSSDFVDVPKTAWEQKYSV